MNTNRDQDRESPLDEWNLSNTQTNVSGTSVTSYQSQRTHSPYHPSDNSISYNSNSALVQKHRLLHRRRYTEISLNGISFFIL